MKQWPLKMCAVLVAMILLAAPRAGYAEESPITIERTPVEITRRTFNPRNPPADMPKLAPHEAAVCVSDFRLNTNLSYQIDRHSVGGAVTREVASVVKVTMRLELKITIWLPENAVPKLVKHEEGHSEMAQQV
jgi:hypothetical protein